MPTAFLFAGQGSQSVGMGKDLASSCPDCAALFERADEVLRFPLRRAMWEGSADDLRHTAVLQPALLALEVAQARHLRAMGLGPGWLAGHSVGQYSALVVAESLPFEEALHLVRERGLLMQEAVPDGVGAMAAVLGLDRAEIRRLCRIAAGVVGIASHNAPGNTVISGERAAVAEASALCKEAGASIVELPVSAPCCSRRASASWSSAAPPISCSAAPAATCWTSSGASTPPPVSCRSRKPRRASRRRIEAQPKRPRCEKRSAALGAATDLRRFRAARCGPCC